MARCGFARQGPVRDGRQPALGPRQRLLHRLRRGQARGLLRHAAGASSRPARSRPCWRTSSATSSTATCPSASRRCSRSAWPASRCSAGCRSRPGSTPAWACTPNLAAPNDALALLLFMLALPVFGFFVSPLFARLSRRHEFEADAYACAQASGADLATALLKLHEDNAATLTPDPVYVRFYYSHPPASRAAGRACKPLSRHERTWPHQHCKPLAGPAADERARDRAPPARRSTAGRSSSGAIEKTFRFENYHETHRLRECRRLDRHTRRPPPRRCARLRPLRACASTRTRSAASRSTTSSAPPRWMRCLRLTLADVRCPEART